MFKIFALYLMAFFAIAYAAPKPDIVAYSTPIVATPPYATAYTTSYTIPYDAAYTAYSTYPYSSYVAAPYIADYSDYTYDAYFLRK